MKNSVSVNARALVFFLLAMSMATANAVPIVFEWTGDATPDGWTGTGEVVIDDAYFGSVLDANLLEQWSFSWTDGVTTHGIDHTFGVFISGFKDFTVDASGVVTQYNLVAGLPGATGNIIDYPLIGLSSGVFSSWGATTASGIGTELTFSNGWGEGALVQVVPLPGTLTLLGAGLLALGIRRRQTQTIKPSK